MSVDTEQLSDIALRWKNLGKTISKISEIASKRIDEMIEKFKNSLPSDMEGVLEVSAAEMEKFISPVGVQPRTGIPEGVKPKAEEEKADDEKGRGYKTRLIETYLRENPEARNKDVVDFYAKKGIEINASQVSSTKTKMGLKKRKRRSTTKAAKSAVAKKRSGMTMVEAAVKVMTKNKEGLRANKIFEGVKKYYSYGGDLGEEGMKNCFNQALHSLCKKKPRRGWKGMPVVLHDKDSHTYRLNPKAEKMTA